MRKLHAAREEFLTNEMVPDEMMNCIQVSDWGQLYFSQIFKPTWCRWHEHGLCLIGWRGKAGEWAS